MTPTQIAAVISATGESADSPALIKLIRLGSGASFSIQASPGVPGRYSVAFNDSAELALMTPVSAHDSTTSGSVLPLTMVSYDNIESIEFWPSGTAIA